MTPFEAPVTLREAAARQLREEIIRGEIQPGTVIRDAEIAARFGISITPVREAISQLTAEGLIDLAPNRSRRVTAVTQKSALDLVDVMALLACAGVEHAVDNITADHLRQLRDRYQRFDAALEQGDMVTAGAVGADFSTVLISAGGNRELQIHIDLVVSRTLRILALTPQSEVWKVWREGYREVLEHLEAGDAPGAVQRHARIYAEFRQLLESMTQWPE